MQAAGDGVYMLRTKIKAPDYRDRFRAINFNGTVRCAKCADPGSKIKRANCQDCAKSLERVKQARQWMIERGLMEDSSC